VTWTRAPVAAALAAQIAAATDGTVAVFPKPPQTINPPAIVVGRPRLVRYATVAFSIDDVELSVLCAGPIDGDDTVDALADTVRRACLTDRTLGGTVSVAYPYEQGQWRASNVAGIDLLVCEVIVAIQQ